MPKRHFKASERPEETRGYLASTPPNYAKGHRSANHDECFPLGRFAEEMNSVHPDRKVGALQDIV